MELAGTLRHVAVYKVVGTCTSYYATNCGDNVQLLEQPPTCLPKKEKTELNISEQMNHGTPHGHGLVVDTHISCVFSSYSSSTVVDS